LVIAPAEQLAAELFVFKTAAIKRLPMPHVIKSDVSYAHLPVAYALYGFVAGTMLSEVSDETLMRIAARQYGRAVKALHTSETTGCGAPQPSGVWPNQSWSAALESWFHQSFGGEALRGILGRNVLQSLYAATTQSYAEHVSCCLVGAVGPTLARATIHSHIQLEGIVRTGRVVAGDPMFDVAATMRQEVPIPFRQGFIEGYTLNTPLTDYERERIKNYTLLWRVYELIERTQGDNTTDTTPVAQSVVAAITQLLASRPSDRPR
jgi:aminoglycoside phosphotransferase (APT) family kinase protein